MAKKKSSRRPNVSPEVLERARAELRGEKLTSADAGLSIKAEGGAAVAAVKPKSARAGMGLASRRVATAEELNAEYHYVASELRYVLILAGILFATVRASADRSRQ